MGPAGLKQPDRESRDQLDVENRRAAIGEEVDIAGVRSGGQGRRLKAVTGCGGTAGTGRTGKAGQPETQTGPKLKITRDQIQLRCKRRHSMRWVHISWPSETARAGRTSRSASHCDARDLAIPANAARRGHTVLNAQNGCVRYDVIERRGRWTSAGCQGPGLQRITAMHRSAGTGSRRHSMT